MDDGLICPVCVYAGSEGLQAPLVILLVTLVLLLMEFKLR